MKQKKRWASSVIHLRTFAKSSFSDSDTLSFPTLGLVLWWFSVGFLHSCFICLSCTQRDTVMASLCEFVEQETGASPRSKLSITSESSLASVASLSMPLVRSFLLFQHFCLRTIQLYWFLFWLMIFSVIRFRRLFYQQTSDVVTAKRKSPTLCPG